MTTTIPAQDQSRPNAPRAAALRPRVLVASADDDLRCYLADHLWVDGADVVEIARCPILVNDVCALEPAMDPADLFIGDARAMRLGTLVALSSLHSAGQPPRMLVLVPSSAAPVEDDDEHLLVIDGTLAPELILAAARRMLGRRRAPVADRPAN